MLLNDQQIIALCEVTPRSLGMITPFEPSQVRVTEQSRIISYGTSSFGYDLRLCPDGGFRVFSPIGSAEIDPKNFDEKCLVEAPLRKADDSSYYWLLPPHTYALGVTVETFNMPDNVLGVCVGKSTLARCGLILNTTPLEPMWCGKLVLEIANAADVPVRVYANEGVAQCLFFQGETPSITYAGRSGKYQHQTGITLAKV